MWVRSGLSPRRLANAQHATHIDLLAARRVKHPDYVEARRIDERDAKREAIELDKRAVIIDHLYGYEC